MKRQRSGSDLLDYFQLCGPKKFEIDTLIEKVAEKINASGFEIEKLQNRYNT